jgi:predicted metal-dependent enzyme (double-stranded beta helix superfamily)
MSPSLSSPFPAHAAAGLDQLVALPPALVAQTALLMVRQLAGEYAELLVRGVFAADPPDSGGGPQLVRHREGRDAAWWLGYFRWPPGAATPIHDHTSWGV